MIVRPSRPGQSIQSRTIIDFASAALRAGNILGARQALHNRLSEVPNDADVLAKLAEIAMNQKSIEEATLLLRRAAGVDPSTDRRVALIEHLQRSGNAALALAEIEELAQSVRKRVAIKEIESAVLSNLGFHERALTLRQEIVRERPAEPRPWCTLATSYRTVGRIDEAVKALRRAARLAPTYGETWWHLSNLKSYEFSSNEIRAMRRALGAVSGDDEIHIHFALGKALEDRGAYRESFEHYSAGNALRAHSFSAEQTISAAVDLAISRLTPEFFDRNRLAGSSEAGPIFVVGMHRSGSTLVEQILASHPMIEGTAELPLIGNICGRLERETRQPAAQAIAALPPEKIKSIGSEYLKLARSFRKTERPFFVDKMPGNWVSLGLIRSALPNAKIIDARRHPMACGFSNFKQYYPKGMGFSFSLKTIGIFYLDYWRFMTHFDRVQPGSVHRIINERLIERPEDEIRAMLEFLDLPFHPSCLEFHKNNRAVLTPSAEQVRRSINSDGVAQWKNYECWLDDLREALGPALESWTE